MLITSSTKPSFLRPRNFPSFWSIPQPAHSVNLSLLSCWTIQGFVFLNTNPLQPCLGAEGVVLLWDAAAQSEVWQASTTWELVRNAESCTPLDLLNQSQHFSRSPTLGLKALLILLGIESRERGKRAGSCFHLNTKKNILRNDPAPYW